MSTSIAKPGEIRGLQIIEIHAKCIEANREILKMTFGCEVRRFKNTAREFFAFFDPASATGRRVYVYREDGTVWPDEAENLTIIGRPIRLADVLLAIQEKYTDVPLPPRKLGTKQRQVTTRPRQLFIKNGFLFFEKDAKGSLLAYDLRKDDLTEQSDECLEFLAQLLK